MGIIDKLVGGTIAEPIEAVGNVITGIWGDKGEKLTHDEVMARLALQPGLAQAEINKVEAAHRNVFVAGWRPMIGWICAWGLAFPFIIDPVFHWIDPAMTSPEFPTGVMMELTLGMLGIAGLRTVEKIAGVAK